MMKSARLEVRFSKVKLKIIESLLDVRIDNFNIEMRLRIIIAGVKIQFSGRANVNFRMGNARYVGKNEYFNVTVYVLGDGE